MRTILHIDFNSYFATVEQQANPRLRGKPIGVTGGDRMERTVLGAASVEAKKMGVKGGMMLWEAKKICPQIIIVPGDSDKYLACTTKFINILKDFSPYLEIFSIDEVFLEFKNGFNLETDKERLIKLGENIKARIKSEVGEWMKCSIGISYNRLMAKLASDFKKPDGLVVIPNSKVAMEVLDKVELDDICGIGSRIKKRLFNLGIKNFKNLRQVPKETLMASFKSYGEVLYQIARGLDDTQVTPFYQKEEVKSIGHRHTLTHDTKDPIEIKQTLLKISEMVAVRLRTKKLIGKTVSCWYRKSLNFNTPEIHFEGGGMQKSLGHLTHDGLEIFETAWQIFSSLWQGDSIRMIGASITNLKPENPKNLFILEEDNRQELILNTLDKVNNKFGDFTLKRAVLLGSEYMRRKPNPYLSDRRFKF